MRIIFPFFLILNITISYSQIDSLAWKKISEKSFVSDKETIVEKSINKFVLDSLQIKIWKYKSKIKSKVLIPKSGTELYINSYLDHGNLYLVRIKEESLKSNEIEEAFKETELYYDKGSIIDFRVSYGVPVCMWMPKSFDEEFEYNQNLTFEILDILISEIINQVIK